MSLFYSDVFVLPLPSHHRFPMGKYGRLRSRLLASGNFVDNDFRVPEAASDAEITRAHCPQYLRRVATGALGAAEVRAIAAVALGKLKHKAALPSLRTAATDDTDDVVRKKAREAALAVAKANDLDAELPGGDPTAAAPTVKQARHTKGFGHSPHAVADAPDLYVMIKSSSDDSPGKADKPTRKQNAEVVKAALLDSFKNAPQVTLTAADAQRWGLDPRTIDLSVVKMDVATNGGYVEIAAELRLAISDDKGKMLSFLSGGAKVQIPSAKFKGQFLPNYRREALEGAMHGMFDKLLAHLRQQSQS